MCHRLVHLCGLPPLSLTNPDTTVARLSAQSAINRLPKSLNTSSGRLRTQADAMRTSGVFRSGPLDRAIAWQVCATPRPLGELEPVSASSSHPPLLMTEAGVIRWHLRRTLSGPSLSPEKDRRCQAERRPYGLFDQAGQSNAFKKDIQLACHFLFLAPARFCGTSFPIVGPCDEFCAPGHPIKRAQWKSFRDSCRGARSSWMR
jgi:hypothetical protein